MNEVRYRPQQPPNGGARRSAIVPGRSRVLLVGASGFIGSAVANALADEGWSTTRLHRRADEQPAKHSVLQGDLTDLQSLVRACEGRDVVINAASFVANDARMQREVNAVGASNLATAARLAGVSRLVYISTTSVYGGKAPNGTKEVISDVIPRSSLGSSRLAAERATLAVGGVVLRPHLVYGPGDRFFLPPLIMAMRLLGGWIEHGQARISTISSESLARVIVEVATDMQSLKQGTIVHAAHPETVTVAQLIAKLLEANDWTPPQASHSAEYALNALSGRGIGASQIRMVAEDNWVDSTALWNAVKSPPGPRVDLSPASKSWYRNALTMPAPP